jgi:hypothetical protein
MRDVMKHKVLLFLLMLMFTPAFAGEAMLRGTIVPDASSAGYDARSKECKAADFDYDFPWGISYNGLEGYRVAAYLVVNGEKKPLADVVIPAGKTVGFLEIPHVTWPPNTKVQIYFTLEDSQGTLVDDASRGDYECTAQ